jgi:prefoldin subunit 5
MKKSILFSGLMIAATSINAQTIVQTWNCGYCGTSDNCTATADVTATLMSDSTMIISGTGAMKNYGYLPSAPNTPWFSTLRDAIKTVIIEDGVTTIGSMAFQKSSRITSITVPNSVTSIGNAAFQTCICLTSENIGNSLTSIGINAFQGCTGLTSVIIGNLVTSIGGNAFLGCSNLTSMTSLNPTPPVAGTAAFNSVNSAFCVYVPTNALADYKAAAIWKNISCINTLMCGQYNDILQAQNSNLLDSITKLNNSITALNNNIDGLNTDISDLQGENTALLDSITTLNTANTTLQGLLSNCETDGDVLLDSLSALNNDIADLNDNITILTTEIGTLNDSINALWKEIEDLLQQLETCGQGSSNAQLIPENHINIHPNPVNYELQITNYDFRQGDVVTLYDMMGKCVYAARVNSAMTSFTIEMTAFPSGNYLLRIGDRAAKVVKR